MDLLMFIWLGMALAIVGFVAATLRNPKQRAQKVPVRSRKNLIPPTRL